MASEEYAELLRLGPFVGLDATKAGTSVEPGNAVSSSNCNPTIIDQALTGERGRTPMFDFSPWLSSVTALVQCIGLLGNPPYYIVGGLDVTGSAFAAYLYEAGESSPTLIPGAVTFDQAVQFSQVAYTNGGQQFFPSTIGGALRKKRPPYWFLRWDLARLPDKSANRTCGKGDARMDF